MSTRQPMRILKGVGKQLEIYADRVLIRRTDALAMLLPVGFGGQTVTRFDEIARVDLHEPEALRLEDCAGKCLQLIITRRDHTTVSLTLDREQRPAAQAMRAYIEARMGGEVSAPKPQNNHA